MNANIWKTLLPYGTNIGVCVYVYRRTYQWYKFPITPVKTSDLNLFLMLDAIYAVWNQVK